MKPCPELRVDCKSQSNHEHHRSEHSNRHLSLCTWHTVSIRRRETIPSEQEAGDGGPDCFYDPQTKYRRLEQVVGLTQGVHVGHPILERLITGDVLFHQCKHNDGQRCEHKVVPADDHSVVHTNAGEASHHYVEQNGECWDHVFVEEVRDSPRNPPVSPPAMHEQQVLEVLE